MSSQTALDAVALMSQVLEQVSGAVTVMVVVQFGSPSSVMVSVKSPLLIGYGPRSSGTPYAPLLLFGSSALQPLPVFTPVTVRSKV